jgi:predicted ATPase
MADEHVLYALIAKAICDAQKDDPEHQVNPEEAKQIAKCIVEALADAGFQIAPLGKE